MAHKQRTPFTLKSGNKTSFKAMGSSPMQIRFASPEAGAILPQNSGINGGGNIPKKLSDFDGYQATLPQGGISGQAMPTPASKPQTPEMMKARKAREEWYLKARAQQGLTTINPQQAQIDLFNQANKAQPTINPQQAMGDLFNQASKAVPQGPNTMRDRPMPTQQHGTYQDAEMQRPEMMKQRSRGDYENFERGLKGEESSNRSRYGQVRGLVNTNAQAPAQPNTPQAAVQSAPRPDLSGGPRQPMGAPRQPMGRPTGGPGQLPPNKGRRRPSTGPGMGRARRATGLARRARRATGLARRVRRSRG